MKTRIKVAVIPKVLPDKLTPPATAEENPVEHRSHLEEEVTPKESVETVANEVLNENAVATLKKMRKISLI